MNKDEKIAYLAGLFDGEGSFSIQVKTQKSKQTNPNFIPKMTMTLKHGNEVLDELVEEFGGSVYNYSGGFRRYNLGKKELLKEATLKLLPYLRIKQDIAARFYEALCLFPGNYGISKFDGERSWTPDLVEKVMEIAYTLNPQTARKCNKDLNYIKKFTEIIYN